MANFSFARLFQKFASGDGLILMNETAK